MPQTPVYKPRKTVTAPEKAPQAPKTSKITRQPATPTSSANLLTTFNALSLAWELVWLIAIPAVILALLGHLADRYLQSSPFLLILGLFLAFGLSSYLVYQKTIKLYAQLDDLSTPTKKGK